MKLLQGALADDCVEAARLLSVGKIVGIPTETVYGLAADARNEEAVRRIFAVKGRPLIDPLIVHCDSLETVRRLGRVSETVRRLAESFWPGPLTLVLPKTEDCGISSLVSAGLPTLAVRVPAHPVLRNLLTSAKIPLAAPSANPFGYVSPTRASHVIDSLGDRIDAVLDGGACQHGLESTILSVSDSDEVRLLRAGPIPSNLIESALQRTVKDAVAATERPEAPGLLASHYRPTKGIRLCEEGRMKSSGGQGEARVFLRRPENSTADCFWFSENGDPDEIARNLFDLLRKLDTDHRYQAIRVEFPASSEGILRAVRDRLARAAVPPSR